MNVFRSDWFVPPPRPPGLLANADDRRLIRAAAPVLFVTAMVLAHIYSPESLSLLSQYTPELVQQMRDQRQREVYPVLVEQDYRPEVRTDQARALSDVSAEGTGGITALAGFHTLSAFDQLTRPQAGGAPSANAGEAVDQAGEGQRAVASANRSGNNSAVGDQAQQLRIPANYRFRQDFLFRFDGSSLLSVPRQELAGYQYFRDMLRKIRENFAPPGQNYLIYDRAGYVLNQPIKPGSVAVQFRIDRDGNVSDVRLVSSMGQVKVNEACMDTLRGQNFGPPPPEVLRHGDIFGINFVFPPAPIR